MSSPGVPPAAAVVVGAAADAVPEGEDAEAEDDDPGVAEAEAEGGDAAGVLDDAAPGAGDVLALDVAGGGEGEVELELELLVLGVGEGAGAPSFLPHAASAKVAATSPARTALFRGCLFISLLLCC